VRLELDSAPAGAAIDGSSLASVVNGSAIFAPIRINRPGSLRLRAVVVGAEADTARSAPIVVVPSPVIVDSTRTRLISTPAQFAAGTLVYQNATGMPSLSPGSIVVGADSGGYLRRVVAVDQAGLTVIASTVPASLTEVVRSGRLQASTQLNATALREGVSLDGRVQWGRTAIVTSPSFVDIENGRYKFRQKVLWKDGDDELVLTGGYVGFEPLFSLDIDLDNWEVRAISASATGNIVAGLDLTLRTQAALPSIVIPELPVATVYKPFVAVVAGWPVYGRVKMTYTLVPKLAVSAPVNLATGITATGGVTVGAAYTRNGWQFNGGPSAQTDIDFNAPKLTAEGGVSAGLGAKVALELRLYEADGPRVWAMPYFDAGVLIDVARNRATTRCRSAMELGVGMAVGLFGFAIADFSSSADFLAREWVFGPCGLDTEIFGTRTIAAVAGSGQLGNIGEVLATPLQVRVLGSGGSPAAGVPVSFVVESGGGQLSAASVVTDANGNAQVRWTLGTADGPQSVVARLFGATGSPVTFTGNTLGTVTGMVTDARTNSPLGNATVRFSCGNRPSISVATDGAGRFTSPRLPTGECELTVTRSDYRGASRNIFVLGTSTADVGRIALQPVEIATLGGVVRASSTNAAIGGAIVEMFAGASIAGVPIAQQTASDAGTFAFNGIPPGTYSLRARAPGGGEGSVLGISVAAFSSVGVTVLLGGLPTISLGRTVLEIDALLGAGPVAEGVPVVNGGSGLLSGLSIMGITYSAGASGWLTATLRSPTAPTILDFSIAPGAVPVGMHEASVLVASSNAGVSPATLTVRLRVSAAVPAIPQALPEPVAYPNIANTPSGLVVLGGINNQGGCGGFRRRADRWGLGSWESVTAPPSSVGVAFPGVTAVDGDVYVIGGQRCNELTRGAFRFNVAAGVWTALPDLPQWSLFASTAVVGSRVFVAYLASPDASGAGPNSAMLDAYDVSSGSWSRLGSVPGGERGYYPLVAVGGRLYAPGGTIVTGGQTDRVDVYDPNAGSWSTAAPLPVSRVNHMAAAVGNKLYVMGGTVPDGASFATTNRVDVYDPASNQWTSGPALRVPRQQGRAFVSGALVCVAGGSVDPRWNTLNISDSIECLDTTQPMAGWRSVQVNLKRSGSGDGVRRSKGAVRQRRVP
jgi:hypothetical protein